jgi:hypothetical protein
MPSLTKGRFLQPARTRRAIGHSPAWHDYVLSHFLVTFSRKRCTAGLRADLFQVSRTFCQRLDMATSQIAENLLSRVIRRTGICWAAVATAAPGTDCPFAAAKRFRPIAEALLPCRRGGPDAKT